jgi:cytochrome c
VPRPKGGANFHAISPDRNFMRDRQNTINGWILGALIVALGGTIVSGEVFKGERPEHMGYPIEGVVEEGAGAAEADKPIAFYLASADPAKGEAVFKKCVACHNADKGGPNALGPNLWDVLGEPVGKGKGFAFSEALAKKGGSWDWQTLSDWLANPRKFAPGTKMTFAGLSNPQDRANVIAFLNAHSDSPEPLPAAPPEAVADAKTPGAVPGTDAEAGAKEPVLTEQQAAKGPDKNIGGEGAAKLTGTQEAKKKN